MSPVERPASRPRFLCCSSILLVSSAAAIPSPRLPRACSSRQQTATDPQPSAVRPGSAAAVLPLGALMLASSLTAWAETRLTGTHHNLLRMWADT